MNQQTVTVNQDRFQYDVFLSNSVKDKAVVRPLAERLRQDGLKVWFDDWVLKPGESIPAKIEEGLEHSHVLVLCMSANEFGSDWAQSESATFRFREPLNTERRFIPLRLDDTPMKGSRAQFHYVNCCQSVNPGECPGGFCLECVTQERPVYSQKARAVRGGVLFVPTEVLETATGPSRSEKPGKISRSASSAARLAVIMPPAKPALPWGCLVGRTHPSVLRTYDN